MRIITDVGKGNFAFSALTLLLGGRNGMQPIKNECWDAGLLVWSVVQTCIWPS